MVLGVPEATLRIPDGATVAVDGVAGVVRWIQ
jgi:phosphohistidine swiveling domain-containing protein